MTLLKGFVEGSLDKVKDQVINRDKVYFVEDLPENGITNAQMEAVLADNTVAAFYQVGNVFVCTDEGNYKKGHLYKFTNDSWEDITDTSATTDANGEDIASTYRRIDDSYSKEETNSQIDAKITDSLTNYYTKEQVYSKQETYTKAEIEALLPKAIIVED